MKDDAERVSGPRAQTAHTVAHIDAVMALGAADRPVVYGKNDGVTLAKRHHFGAALHPRPLLGQHELAAGEIAPWLGEQDRNLEREGKLAIEVLMQAIEIARHVFEKQWRRARLTRIMTKLQKIIVSRRVSFS